MKKRKVLIGLLAASAMLSIASCKTNDEPNDDSNQNENENENEKETYTVTFNTNGGSAVSEQKIETGNKATKPNDPSKTDYKFIGWYTDEALTKEFSFDTAITSNITLYAKWEAVQPEVTYEINYVLNGHGEAIDKTTAASLPATLPTPTDENYDFLGWYTDEALKTPAVAGSALTGNITLYADWIRKGYERVSYNLLADDLTVGKPATETIVGNYTISGNTEVRSRSKNYTDSENPENNKSFKQSIKLGASADTITINVPGDGVFSMYVQNGSSSAVTQNITVTKTGGVPDTINFAGTNEGSPVVKLDVEVTAGEYKITRPSGTVDVFLIEMTCEVEKAEETGFEIVANGVVDYIEGQEYDPSSIQLNKVYGNGRTETLDINDSNVTINSENYNSTIPGTYEIIVSYKNYEQQSFTVNVYEFDEIELDFINTSKISNNKWGNGVYFNDSVKRVYKTNDTFDASNLTVTALASLDSKSESFYIPANLYTLDIDTSFDSSIPGEKTITVSLSLNNKVKTAQFKVYVVDTLPSVVNEVVQLKVDQSYEGVVGSVVEGYNMFTSIQQALDYIDNIGAEYNNSKKVISLAAGTYREKIEITKPNIEIVGADKESTIIEWDSLYGLTDPNGFVQVTDSTATLNVRDAAENCKISNVTISNYWNNATVFDQAFGYNYSEHRALALLVQADKFSMDNCKLLGYQDTVEFMSGRQYIANTYIQGTTDFIFGTNNTTYFYQCQIHSIDAGKVKTFDENNAPIEYNTDGGYITAFKGCNKGASDSVEYGAIFDACDFTADQKVLDAQNTAIARPWGAYAAVMVMNSNLGGHISKNGYVQGDSKNKRYVSMSGINPTDATVKFFEYNNTGDGAITESVAGCTVLTDATVAANYNNFEVIYGISNGNVSYGTPWNPTSNEVAVDNNTYYNFNGTTSTSGTSYTYSGELNGTTSTLGDLTLDATAGKISARTSDTQLNKGAKITFTVAAGSSVTVSTYPGYHGYSLNGLLTSSDNFTQYYASETVVTLEATETMYLLSITIRPNQEAPSDKVLESLTISGQKTEFQVNEAFTSDSLVVKANYSDSSIKVLDASEYQITHQIDITTPNTYTVTVTFGDKEITYDVVYVTEINNAISESVTYSFKDDTSNAATNYIVYDNSAIDPQLKLGKITIESNGGSAADNGDWLKFNAGSKVSFEVSGACTVTVVYYQNQVNSALTLNGNVVESTTGVYNITEAGNIVLEATASGYIGQIIITFA